MIRQQGLVPASRHAGVEVDVGVEEHEMLSAVLEARLFHAHTKYGRMLQKTRSGVCEPKEIQTCHFVQTKGTCSTLCSGHGLALFSVANVNR